MLVHIKDLLHARGEEKYSIGAFNIYNLESALGIARAAQQERSPVIIQVSESTIRYAGLKPITHIVSTVAKNEVPDVPVALHLDHGKSFDAAIECINAGFTSVHIDASAKPLDENIAITRDVVKYAHDRGVWVQGEVGVIIGAHGAVGDMIAEEIPLADPDEVFKFVEETGVDTVSAAVGTAHGAFKNEKIHFDLLGKIVSNLEIPFVLHGASGNDKDLKKVVEVGVSIVNIGTDIKEAFVKAIIKAGCDNPQIRDPRDLLKPGIQAIQDTAAQKIRLFNSNNKAK